MGLALTSVAMAQDIKVSFRDPNGILTEMIVPRLGNSQRYELNDTSLVDWRQHLQCCLLHSEPTIANPISWRLKIRPHFGRKCEILECSAAEVIDQGPVMFMPFRPNTPNGVYNCNNDPLEVTITTVHAATGRRLNAIDRESDTTAHCGVLKQIRGY